MPHFFLDILRAVCLGVVYAPKIGRVQFKINEQQWGRCSDKGICLNAWKGSYGMKCLTFSNYAITHSIYFWPFIFLQILEVQKCAKVYLVGNFCFVYEKKSAALWQFVFKVSIQGNPLRRFLKNSHIFTGSIKKQEQTQA